jgi:predicted dinucleotide-binding enzyme
MRIAIIGAGNVGKTLGGSLRAKGHAVVSSRARGEGRDFAFVMARREDAADAKPRVRAIHPQGAE